MENLANEAAILAVRRNKRAITMEEFDDAIDRVIAGPAKKSKVVSETELKLVAYHETGHAILGELLEHGHRTHKVTIVPRGRAGGYTIPLPEEERSFHTKKELLDRVVSLLGGRAAEEVFLDDISTGAQNDMERATRLVRAMVTEYGMSEKIGPLTLGQKHDEQIFLGRDISRQRNYSEEVAAAVDKEISTIINQCYQKAVDLLKENADKVEKIVEALIERETLDSEDIRKLMKGEPLAPVEKTERVLQLNTGLQEEKIENETEEEIKDGENGKEEKEE